MQIDIGVETRAVLTELIQRWRKNPGKCPLCTGEAPFRRGVHFEHERLCAACDFSFDPAALNQEFEEVCPADVTN